MKLYENREWLFDQYIRKNKTAKQIAKEVGRTEMTIYNWLLKFDLLRLKGKGRKLGKRVVKSEY